MVDLLQSLLVCAELLIFTLSLINCSCLLSLRTAPDITRVFTHLCLLMSATTSNPVNWVTTDYNISVIKKIDG